MDYCAELLFWWQTIVLILLISILFIINGKSFILLRGIARDVRETSRLLYGSLLGPDAAEGPRAAIIQTGHHLRRTESRLPPISEEEGQMAH
ncbi:V4 [Trifolium virus 1]|nr:V4 protein [Trifolium virus 1]QVS02804.1 V4 [Trifolium virus 1]QVS02810.1 V4 [Trifolium virus 1]